MWPVQGEVGVDGAGDNTAREPSTGQLGDG